MSGYPSQELINKNYLALIRNVKRNFWFLLSHFGASPVAHKSYLYGRDNSLEKYGAEDLFLPAATSLRMSNVGYQSPILESLQIKYNDLDEFIDAVVKGINTPNKEFEQMGLFDATGLPQQISSGILQIENELYDIIRPKRTGSSGDRPSALLRQHGIEYIELRGIDINPFVPEGISENAIKLLDIFLMHSLISESPNISKDEAQEISSNNHEMVINGRSKDVTLIKNGLLCPLSEIKKTYYEELGLIAAAMDGYSSGYLTAFNSEMNLGRSLSEKIMEEMEAQKMSFAEYGLTHSQSIASSYPKPANRDFSRFIDSSKASLQELKKVEESSSMDINKYVELYNSKLKEEK
jgi:glutamate--cysteine ligase